jgi:hypothetical protein
MLGASVGLRTINERINRLESLLAQAHREPISGVPAVVQFDGIWLSNAQWAKASWWETSRSLSLDLLTINP